MKKLFFILSTLISIFWQGGREAQAQNLTILPSGITPAPAGAIPRISYAAIMALPSPQGGDLAYDLTFNVMRMYNGKNWLIMAANNPQVWGSAVFSALSTESLFCRGVAADNAGNIYLIGNFYDSVSIQGITLVAAGNYDDIFIAKFNRFGALQWLRRGGTGGMEHDEGNDIAVDGSGNVYITGEFYGTANFNTPSNAGSNELVSAGSADIFIAKYNTAGTLQWLRRGGGIDTDIGNGIAVDVTGNVYVTGLIIGTANFNTPSAFGGNELVSAGGSDVFVAKYNTSGTLQWLRRAGGGTSDSGSDIGVDGSGNVYVTGGITGTANFNTPASTGSNELVSAGGGDVFVAKYNTSGIVQWLRRAGGISSESVGGIAVDGSGNVHITGSFDGTVNFNTPSSTGSNELVSVGGPDVFIAKYNTSGAVQWLRRAGSVAAPGNTDSGRDIAVDGSGNVYVTGNFRNTANFNTPSSTGSNELESAGLEDIFIAQYSNSGTLQWLQRAGGGQSEGASGLALGANGGANSMLYIVGTYQGITQLGVTELHNPSGTAGFLIFIKR